VITGRSYGGKLPKIVRELALCCLKKWGWFWGRLRHQWCRIKGEVGMPEYGFLSS
jgi:hypothetical protein